MMIFALITTRESDYRTTKKIKIDELFSRIFVVTKQRTVLSKIPLKFEISFNINFLSNSISVTTYRIVCVICLKMRINAAQIVSKLFGGTKPMLH